MTSRYWATGAAVAALIMATGSAIGAHADPTLQFAPPDAWIKPVALPKTLPSVGEAPIRVLIEDRQLAFDADGYSDYTEYAYRIDTPEGLQAAMTVLSWNPDNAVATVHKVHILRGDQVIDVLADGQTFQTMRRENNLEQSMLDGTLTGVLQPEDVQVGDILDYSMTIRHEDPLFKGHNDAVMANLFPVPVSQMHMRAVWPKTLPLRWRTTDDLTGAKVTKTADGSELDITAADYLNPTGPDQAPGRFAQFGQVEVTQFTGWADVAALVAPLYDKASTLAPTSKLHAEADKIRALSTDPKVQAAAALQLAQNKVRYVFLGMNEGGYVPADADTTWSRRFGDCKGKTVLLLALLKELGIKAEPSLVSTRLGDGLDQRLPLMDVFDHVMVRAEIAGKVYWLDGTRYGDRDLDSLAIPDFSWALPVQATGSALEALKPAPLDIPGSETVIRIDATAGIDTPAPTHLEAVVRGDSATQLNTKMAAMTAADADKAMRDYWHDSYDFITPDKVSWTFDKTTGTLRYILDGKAKMDWDPVSSSHGRQYEADSYRLGWTRKLDRDATKPHADAPMALAYPYYTRTNETVLLPNGGAGFTIKGDPVDTTISGYAFKRTLAIKDGAFVMEASTRGLVPEITYKDAVAAIDPIKKLRDGNVYVRAPMDYKATDADLAAGHDMGDAKSAQDYVDRGDDLFAKDKYADATTAYDMAIKLDPKNARAVAGRGLVKLYQDDKTGAAADFDAAEAIDSNVALIYDGRADLARRNDDYNGALAAFTRALEIDPNDSWALEGRAGAYMMLDDNDHALKDALADLKTHPKSVTALRIAAVIYDAQGKSADAIAQLRKAIEVEPDAADLHMLLASSLADCIGRGDTKDCEAQRSEAISEFDKSIALQPTAEAYCARALVRRQPADQALSLADIDAAIKLDAKAVQPYFTRGLLWMQAKTYDKAVADFSQVMVLDPKNADGLRARAEAYDDMDNVEAQIADLQAAAILAPDDGEIQNELCWADGTNNRDLDKGLMACNLALKLQPASQFYDSRGLIYYQMGKYDLALADYNSALAATPGAVATLFAKGVTELRAGKTKEGQTDIAKAKSLNSHIAEEYAKYGMVP